VVGQVEETPVLLARSAFLAWHRWKVAHWVLLGHFLGVLNDAVPVRDVAYLARRRMLAVKLHKCGGQLTLIAAGSLGLLALHASCAMVSLIRTIR
jgi:hypothetical protein